jgi:hypothetical protein
MEALEARVEVLENTVLEQTTLINEQTALVQKLFDRLAILECEEKDRDSRVERVEGCLAEARIVIGRVRPQDFDEGDYDPNEDVEPLGEEGEVCRNPVPLTALMLMLGTTENSQEVGCESKANLQR